MTFLGYAVEAVSGDPCHVGYRLRRLGATLLLVRFSRARATLYAVNARGHVVNVKGHYRFTDANGKLEVLP